MILALAATEIELSPLQRLLKAGNIQVPTLITGVGPVEAAVRLSRYLGQAPAVFAAVVNFGVGGGYFPVSEEEGPELLELYLAETEAFGDLGICYPERIEPLSEDLTGKIAFTMDPGLLERAKRICADRDIEVRTGNFVTVMGVSATRARGLAVGGRFQGRCENMEGAAVARVCADFSLPVLELRCISNLVEDRDPKGWRLREACEKAAWAAAEIIKGL
jgi:futalosine hydrolase